MDKELTGMKVKYSNLFSVKFHYFVPRLSELMTEFGKFFYK